MIQEIITQIESEMQFVVDQLHQPAEEAVTKGEAEGEAEDGEA
jgi:hypothetical protein